MRFGNYFEPILALHFEQITGFKTRQISKYFKHHEHDFLRANIDRQVLASPKKGLESTAVLELKTTTSHRLKTLDGEYPLEWVLQVQHYLGITGYQQAYLQVYERDTCYFHEPVLINRDDDLIAENMAKLIKWWNTYMIGGSEGRRPEPINGEDALLLYPESESEKVLEVTPKGYELYTEFQEVRSKKSDLIKQEEFLKTKLKDHLGNAERLVLAGKNLVSWKSQSTTRFDVSAFRREHSEFYKQYSKTNKTRRFLCH
jgi:predicted phage-related endonuclease